MSFRRPPGKRTADDFISGAMTSVQTEPAPAAPKEEPAANLSSPPTAPPQEPAAASAPVEPSAPPPLPWMGKRSDKQTELFNLRLTEVELEKLRYIAAHTPDSMQAFVRKALLPAIDAKLDELTRST